MLVFVSAPCCERCNTLLPAGVAPHISEGISTCVHPVSNVGHAALKQSIKNTLAAYAASPFLIEGM